MKHTTCFNYLKLATTEKVFNRNQLTVVAEYFILNLKEPEDWLLEISIKQDMSIYDCASLIPDSNASKLHKLIEVFSSKYLLNKAPLTYLFSVLFQLLINEEPSLKNLPKNHQEFTDTLIKWDCTNNPNDISKELEDEMFNNIYVIHPTFCIYNLYNDLEL